MFDSRGLGSVTTDALEQRMLAVEEVIGGLRGEQMVILEELDRRQVATGDGCRSLSEWVAARLDVSPGTAKDLVRTMRRIQDRPDLRDSLASGDTTFDRVEALSRIPENVGLLQHLDVAGVRREAAKRVRITAEAEVRSVDDSYLVMQPSLDESWWNGHFGVDGYLGSIIEKTLSEGADEVPEKPDGSRGSSSWRKAMALAGLCMSGDAFPPSGRVSVFVDATEAGRTNGETGVVLEAGPRVGRRVLEGILCDGDVEVIARTGDGRYLDYGRSQRTVPPRLKRALLDRYGGRCAGDGCDSRYRLEAHHKTPWYQGGRTDLEDLVLLCWFHHHVVVHRWGYHIYAHPDHGRIRFRKPRFSPESEPSP